MGSIQADLGSRVRPEPIDHFDRLPDSLILLIFNKIGDVKALGRCCVVSRIFHSLVPQVDDVIVRVDCVISDDGHSATSSSASAASDKVRHPIWSLCSGIFKPLLSLAQLITPSSRRVTDQNSVTHHSPTQVLKNFNEIKLLRIELPIGELGIHKGLFLKWKANFGSALDNCVILGATSVTRNKNSDRHCFRACNVNNTDIGNNNHNGNGVENDDGSIPVSFYTDGRFKLRVVWTISTLIAASYRHYLVQPIIAEHKTLENLILTDADGQGVLSMNKEQLEELRVKPLSASSAAKRTLVPALNVRWWYAPQLELPNGMVLKGATLIAILPSEELKKEVVGTEGDWIVSAFDEPFRSAARMLVKRRTNYLDMNSF